MPYIRGGSKRTFVGCGMIPSNNFLSIKILIGLEVDNSAVISKNLNAILEYFIKNYRAVYFVDKNAVYINKKYINGDGDLTFLQILRHEGWHVAQDCMGGGIHNGDLKSILSHEVIPDEITQETFARYGFDPTVVRIEREAVWAMYKPDMTNDALKACNSDVPIWETYFPPQRTWQYLYWNGHIDEGI